MSSPLDVAFVLDSLGSGGAQRQAVELAVRLRMGSGVATRIVVYRPVDPRDRDLYGARLAAASVPVDLVAKRTKFDPTLPTRLGAVLAGRDVVHAFMPAPAFWTWLGLRVQAARQRPTLIAAERAMPSHGNRLDRLVNGFVYRRADAVTVNARPALEEVAVDLRVPRERLHYLPNGIDLDAWDRAAEEPCPYEPEAGFFHLALVGRFEPQKNHALLLEALSRLGMGRLADWRVWFVGGATGGQGFAEAVHADIARRGLGSVVRCVPPIKEIAALLRRLDGLVLPSRYEGFPNALLEALASRLPSVATLVGDVGNMLEDGVTGFVVKSDDADGLARALVRLHAMTSEEREAMGRRARNVVEDRYGMERVANQHLELYQNLTQG